LTQHFAWQLIDVNYSFLVLPQDDALMDGWLLYKGCHPIRLM